MILELFPPRSGEHQFAAYKEEIQDSSSRDQNLFYNKSDGKIVNFWRLPTNNEIVSLPLEMEKFMSTNLPKCFNYNMGNPAEKTLPEFICRNGLEKVKEKV